MDVNAQWDRLLLCLQRDHDAADLDVWFQGARALDLDDERLVVEASNRYYVGWIVENYGPQLRGYTEEVFGRPLDIEFVVPEQEDAQEIAHDGTITTRAPARTRATGLVAARTFDTFVVGECNKLAHAAAQAVCDDPAGRYNPLYIYGATGLGKTHLMHAIGHEVVRRYPSARVVYCTAEDFTNEMINAIRYKSTEAFRSRYREEATLLLVDDIQFLSGKERTQEEFFFTFNALQGQGRQIVITSDVEPRDIKGLEPRLRTRFEGGLVADMQPPDPETLLAILRRKADDAGFHLPDDLAHAIAEVAQGSVRELEGLIHRLEVLGRVRHEPITLEFAREQLPKLFVPDVPVVTVPAIIEVVARFFNLRSADITGQRRTRALTLPRHIAMFLAREHTRLSFPELGKEFGNRDHSTIQHGVRKIASEVQGDPELRHKVRILEQTLGLRTS
ncbi:MAG: chromosomal replication initiator protein DnaA [Alphaproteobacteria bacterium]|nr:chromosomal replication initiator protein DnaA [Alphaproteobacteria bacterium]